MIFIFLSSGLFLGWSLGANDAANIFGTAVGTKMIRFKVAAIIASIFVTLGAVIGGAGASHTLGKLGAVNALPGAFMVAFSAGFTVFMMTKYKLPVSTSQAIVGSIIGWNFYASVLTDAGSLTKIVSTWILCPVLSALIAMALYSFIKWARNRFKINLFAEDLRTRIALIVIGAFGAYSLGANNIANVMGVFVSAEPFEPLNFFGLFTLSSAQILFLIGGIAISIGILTYSHKVMDTVGSSLMRLSPITAFIVVLAESIVLFIFSSEGLEALLVSYGLPSIPLVPVSSSQAVVGAVVGIGLLKSRRQIRLNVLGGIATGWVTTPIISGLITFVFLFFLQNVFNQKVYVASDFLLSDKVIEHLQKKGLADDGLQELAGKSFADEMGFYDEVKEVTLLNRDQISKVISYSKINRTWIDGLIVVANLDTAWLSKMQYQAVKNLVNEKYSFYWELDEALVSQSNSWLPRPQTIGNKSYNKSLKAKIEYIHRTFATENNTE